MTEYRCPSEIELEQMLNKREKSEARKMWEAGQLQPEDYLWVLSEDVFQAMK